MSYLSVFVQYHAAFGSRCRVPRTAFEPTPKSTPRSSCRADPADGAPGSTPADRKQLLAASSRPRTANAGRCSTTCLTDSCHSAERISEALVEAGIDPDRRPQTLAVGEWLRLLERPRTDWSRSARPYGQRAMTPAACRCRPAASHRSSGSHRPSSISAWRSSAGARTASTSPHSVMVLLELADRLSLAPAAGPLTRSTSMGSTPAPTGWTTSSCGRWPASARRSARAGRDRAGRRPGWPPGSTSGSPLPPGWPAAAERCRGDHRWRPRGVGRDADDPRAARGSPSRLGSDVPFFLAGGAALVEGRGEAVSPLTGVVGEPPGAPARHAAAGDPHARGLRRLGRGSHRPAAARSGQPCTSPRSCVPDSARGRWSIGPGSWRSPTTWSRPRRRSSRGWSASPSAFPPARQAGRPIGLGADAVGSLSFRYGGRHGRRRGEGSDRRRGDPDSR